MSPSMSYGWALGRGRLLGPAWPLSTKVTSSPLPAAAFLFSGRELGPALAAGSLSTYETFYAPDASTGAHITKLALNRIAGGRRTSVQFKRALNLTISANRTRQATTCGNRITNSSKNASNQRDVRIVVANVCTSLKHQGVQAQLCPVCTESSK